MNITDFSGFCLWIITTEEVNRRVVNQIPNMYFYVWVVLGSGIFFTFEGRVFYVFIGKMNDFLYILVFTLQFWFAVSLSERNLKAICQFPW